MQQTIVEKIEEYIGNYVAFEEAGVVKAMALWSIATHIFENFDAFPYIVITSSTKRSGKTRLSECIANFACNPKNFSAMTPSTLFRVIDVNADATKWDKEKEENRTPTVIFDEAESLSSESAGVMRSVLNVGYRKGQKVPRTIGNRVHEFNTYCPKIFILIGDVYDTLRDRSIVVSMQRREPKKRWQFEQARNEALPFKKEFASLLAQRKADIIRHYEQDDISFLTDRDEEIWRSILAVGHAIDPKGYEALTRVAVDLCAAKTASARKHTNLSLFEDTTQQDEYGIRLLKDLYAVIGTEKNIYTEEAIARLQAITTAPWRKFGGSGIGPIKMAEMLAVHGVSPTSIRRGNSRKEGSTVAKGYKREDVEEALRAIGIVV